MKIIRSTLIYTVLAVFVAATALAAVQKSCRKCGCDVTITGELGFLQTEDVAGALDDYMKTMAKNFTGSMNELPYYWTKPSAMTAGAAYPSWSGNAYYWRLCGNGKSAQGTWTQDIYKKGSTTIKLDCKECDKSVECLKGSKCEKSTL